MMKKKMNYMANLFLFHKKEIRYNCKTQTLMSYKVNNII